MQSKYRLTVFYMSRAQILISLCTFRLLRLRFRFTSFPSDFLLLLYLSYLRYFLRFIVYQIFLFAEFSLFNKHFCFMFLIIHILGSPVKHSHVILLHIKLSISITLAFWFFFISSGISVMIFFSFIFIMMIVWCNDPPSTKSFVVV